jgi:hypothetical protein
MAAALEQQVRQPALEGGLDRSYQRRRVLATPWGVLPEGLPQPPGEVDEAGLGDQGAGVVVDPVAREWAGTDNFVVR